MYLNVTRFIQNLIIDIIMKLVLLLKIVFINFQNRKFGYLAHFNWNNDGASHRSGQFTEIFLGLASVLSIVIWRSILYRLFFFCLVNWLFSVFLSTRQSWIPCTILWCPLWKLLFQGVIKRKRGKLFVVAGLPLR